MFVINHRKVFYWISGTLMVLAVLAIIFIGFNPGIDFTGGSSVQVTYEGARPDTASVRAALDASGFTSYELRPSGDNKYDLQTGELDQTKQNAAIKALSLDGQAPLNLDSVNTIGPVVGRELANKAYIALALIILAIMLFIAFSFRQVSKPVSSWKYGIATIVALFHDVLIPTGIYVVYSKYTGAQIDLLFVTAVLFMLGYSVYDTIVVFDRVRENLKHNHDSRHTEEFGHTVGKSLAQTYARSINTSLTLVLVLLALLVFGSPATHNFVFVLLMGAIVGTYSSIFLASPMLVTMAEFSARKAK
ncbi:MAG TPA: protein translocase subunit SecF [Candidatus Paceibacterota bacterium]|nr:protein translocase subunit SecF [Candidatus Paceibacterota bacterium]